MKFFLIITNIIFISTIILSNFTTVLILTSKTQAQENKSPSSSTTSRFHIPISGSVTILRNRDSSGGAKDTAIIKDYLSSTRAIINSRGETVETLAYYPYGATHETWSMPARRTLQTTGEGGKPETSNINSQIPSNKIQTSTNNQDTNSNNPKTAIQTQSGSAISKADPISAIRSEAEDQTTDNRPLTTDNRQLTTDRFFTSHRKVADLNIYHAGSRFYNPTLGLFIQPDKVEGINRYSYVGNNPVMFTDPTGNRYIDTRGPSESKSDYIDLSDKYTGYKLDPTFRGMDLVDSVAIDKELMSDQQYYLFTGLSLTTVAVIGGAYAAPIIYSACVVNPIACMMAAGTVAEFIAPDAVPPGTSLVQMPSSAGVVSHFAGETGEMIGDGAQSVSRKLAIGVGNNAETWRARGYNTLDIDPASGADYIADANRLDEVIEPGTLDELYAEYISFDPEGHYGVNQQALLEQASSALKPGGRLVIETGIIEGLRGGKVNIPNVPLFANAMERAGFRVSVRRYNEERVWSWLDLRRITYGDVIYEGIKFQEN